MALETQIPGISEALEAKRQALYARLRDVGRLMVAYSGGTDSAYLAYAAHQALGAEMLAVIADSPSFSRAHLRDAVEFAESNGIPLRVIDTHEMEDAEYVRNDSTRCFHCKDELFKVMAKAGGPLGFSTVAYGMNVDDRGDFRPGQRAAAQHMCSLHWQRLVSLKKRFAPWRGRQDFASGTSPLRHAFLRASLMDCR